MANAQVPTGEHSVNFNAQVLQLSTALGAGFDESHPLAALFARPDHPDILTIVPAGKNQEVDDGVISDRYTRLDTVPVWSRKRIKLPIAVAQQFSRVLSEGSLKCFGQYGRMEISSTAGHQRHLQQLIEAMEENELDNILSTLRL